MAPDQEPGDPEATAADATAPPGCLSPVLNAVIVLAGLAVLVVLIIAALDNLVTTGTNGGTNGASDAIALITAGGAVLTGIVGAYFGINASHQSALGAQAGQAKTLELANQVTTQASSAVTTVASQVNAATQAAATAVAASHQVALAAAAGLDPSSDVARKIVAQYGS